jgi:hypothetical protein
MGKFFILNRNIIIQKSVEKALVEIAGLIAVIENCELGNESKEEIKRRLVNNIHVCSIHFKSKAILKLVNQKTRDGLTKKQKSLLKDLLAKVYL